MKTIGVCTQSFTAGSKAMFEALGEALGVSFERRTFGDDQNIDGWIILSADRTLAFEAARTTRPCYVVLDEAELVAVGTSPTVTFASSSELDPVLRGRDVTSSDATGAKALPSWLPDATPLAFKDGSPVWSVQVDGDCRYHYLALLPPELNDGEPLFRHFCDQRLVCLLPLVLFVRSIAEERGWEPPPLQAAFMFDDPNLHATSYGFIDYSKMVNRAAAKRYHISIATIPLDAWFAHPGARAIFKNNARFISLLYHGNDHVSNELARAPSAATMRSLLRQAIGRITRMEAQTGLEVARVMAPPHGACSETALSEMARLGFEAVYVSRGSLQFHNPRAAWTRTMGMKSCDVVAGLPIVPRFGLSRNNHNDILIAALLRQPIVPMTHHQAVADGYDLLDEVASIVNSFGDVAWRDVRTISRSLYVRKQDADTLLVRPLSNHVSVPVPPGITRMHVERPARKDSPLRSWFWRVTTEDQRWNHTPGDEGVAVQPGTTIEVAEESVAVTGVEVHPTGSPRLAPVARRLLTEARDRALPSFHRLARR